jgi:SAM-dependent methyltransferase
MLVDMEEHMYDDTYAVEDRHWWFRNLRKILEQSIGKHVRASVRLAILDAGCGTGRNLIFYQDYGNAVGIDRSPTGLRYCRQRNLHELALGDVCRLPFRSQSFDLVNSSDVIYALDPAGGEAFVAESYRVLKPGGHLLLNTAAMDILYSDHDRAVMTKKRYCKSEMMRLVTRAGFELIRLRYWNSILFLPVLAHRLVRRIINAGAADTRGDLKPQNKMLNGIFYFMMRLDWALAGTLPFGTSLFCVARKPDANKAKSRNLISDAS